MVKRWSRDGQEKVKIRSREGQEKVKRRSRNGQEMVKRRSREGQEKVKRWSREGHEMVDRRSRDGQGVREGLRDGQEVLKIVDESSRLNKSKITVFNEFIKGFLRCAGISETHLRNISAKCNFS